MPSRLHAQTTALPGVLLLRPQRHADARGFFSESFNARDFAAATGFDGVLVQDNLSSSATGVLRGLHYQSAPKAQGKLVQVLAGRIWDVAVDLRRSSPSFGLWLGQELNAELGQQLWLPPGLAHGFLVLEGPAQVLYKTSDYYAPEHERCIRWDDPDLAINWPLAAAQSPLLSAKDTQGLAFAAAPYFD